MTHELDLILTLTGGLTAALVFGFLTHRIGLSPIVGYLLAGVAVGPFTPGFVANHEIAGQFAEIGVILLMFGVGLHFHLKDLLAVKAVAIPGALVQIAVATGLGVWLGSWMGWNTTAGIVFGIAISVASTVVLTRVLADNRALHTPTGHVAVGWLIVEDLFTVLVLVLLPSLFSSQGNTGGAAVAIGIAVLKLMALLVFTLMAGRRFIPSLLGYVASTRSRELFTLTVLVLALGIAVGSAKLFGASMALGAFLAGMVVGQSDFSSRAASEALPMRDAFAVLFFVSVGMLFDPWDLAKNWQLALATLAVVLIGKPLAAFLVVVMLRRPLMSAVSIAVALAQIGEFSFILAALGQELGILPKSAANALVAAAIVSITVNPLVYRFIPTITRAFQRVLPRGKAASAPLQGHPTEEGNAHRAVVVGYGPVGRTLTRLLRDNGLRTTVIEMNLDTVAALKAQGIPSVYGDATQTNVLVDAGIAEADTLVFSISGPGGSDVIRAAREIKPDIRVLSRSNYLRDAQRMTEAGANAVFSGEGEVALAMTASMLADLGATPDQIDRETDRVRRELFSKQ